MKIKGIIVLTVIMAVLLGSCAKNAIQASKMKTNMDSLSYAIGVLSYSNFTADSLNLDPILMAKAMLDLKDDKAEMTVEEASNVYREFMTVRMADQQAKEAEANKLLYKDYIDQNNAFLEQNKAREGVKVTASGIQYEILKNGTGEKPTAESTVKVHYVGSLIDGKVFDSSVARNEPVSFPLANVIPGWTEALQLMPVGAKFKIWIPSELAYGANGMGEDIKPFSTLVFEVELLEIVQ